MISAVIFDLDGTLLETEELKALSAEELLPDKEANIVVYCSSPR
jgi:beta-phosphoglucomutase-like phosphatase (HAD superfamily)